MHNSSSAGSWWWLFCVQTTDVVYSHWTKYSNYQQKQQPPSTMELLRPAGASIKQVSEIRDRRVYYFVCPPNYSEPSPSNIFVMVFLFSSSFSVCGILCPSIGNLEISRSSEQNSTDRPNIKCWNTSDTAEVLVYEQTVWFCCVVWTLWFAEKRVSDHNKTKNRVPN